MVTHKKKKKLTKKNKKSMNNSIKKFGCSTTEEKDNPINEIKEEIGEEMDMFISKNITNAENLLNDDDKTAQFLNKKQKKKQIIKYQHEILDNNPETVRNKQYIDNGPSLIGIVGDSIDTIKNMIRGISENFYSKMSNRIFIDWEEINCQSNNQKMFPPITLRTSKLRRATFIGLNSFSSYIDGSKICDLSIMTINCEVFRNSFFHKEEETKNHLKKYRNKELNDIIRKFMEYVAMVKSNGGNKIILFFRNYNASFDKSMQILCKEYFSGIHIITSFKKLMHSISYLKNKVTYLKCANSYIFIDDLDVNKDNTSQITVKGYLKGKSLNFSRNDDFYIPLIGKIKVDKIECLNDPTCIENEKILERKKVFFYSPMMNRKEEIIENKKIEQEKTKFLFIDGESIEYESSSDQENNQFDDISNTNDESKNESCNENDPKDENLDFNCLSFEDLKKQALEKLSQNHIVLAGDTEEITSIQFEKQENNFIPGDYLKITFMKSENYTFNDFFFINKIYNDQRQTIRCSSFNPDNYFHPNFIKSHDPIIISTGLYRMIGFPVFFRVLEDGRRLFQKNSRNNTNIKCCFYGYGGKYMPVVIIRQIKNELIQNNSAKNKLTKIHEVENMENLQQVDKKNDKITKKINFSKMNARHIVENINIRYNYRIVGSGLSQNERIENYKTKNISYSSENYIYKKLNLIGKVYQVNGSTSFVKGMFTSSLEANKFLLSNIKTISGIRGVIKKNVSKIGNVRCTFEAPVLKNDTVFLSTFVKVCIQEHFYDNINNYHKRKKEILDDNKIKTEKESDEEVFENFIGNEIKIQKEIKKPIMHRLIRKLPLYKRLERQTIENEELLIKNNEKMKNFIKTKRKELNDNFQKEEKEKIHENKNLEKEKNRIKKEGIYKRMKIRKKRIK